MADKVLVTGGTGTVGSEVISALLAKGQAVKLATRDHAKAAQLIAQRGWSNVEIANFAFDDPDMMRAALDGVDRVFVVTPVQNNAVVEMVATLAALGKAAGVRHFVRLSGMGTEADPTSLHRRCEVAIEESGCAFTHVRPTFFMQNFGTYYRADIVEKGEIALPAGDGKIPFVDVRDIAEVAACAFTDSAHHNKGYALTGGEAHNHAEVAAVLSETLGRPIRYVALSEEELYAAMRALGRPDEYTQGMIRRYSHAKAGAPPVISPAVAQVTGRLPITLRQYVQDYAAVWR